MSKSVPLATVTYRNKHNSADSAAQLEACNTNGISDRQPVAAVTPLLLKRTEVSALINVRPRTFDRLLACGGFPVADIRINEKLIRWKVATVLDWIDRGGK